MGKKFSAYLLVRANTFSARNCFAFIIVPRFSFALSTRVTVDIRANNRSLFPVLLAKTINRIQIPRISFLTPEFIRSAPWIMASANRALDDRAKMGRKEENIATEWLWELLLAAHPLETEHALILSRFGTGIGVSADNK